MLKKRKPFLNFFKISTLDRFHSRTVLRCLIALKNVTVLNVTRYKSVEVFAFDPQVDVVSPVQLPELIKQADDTSTKLNTLARHSVAKKTSSGY